MKIQGKVMHMTDIVHGGHRRPWQSMTIVVRTREDAPSEYAFVAVNDRVSLNTGISVGDIVEVTFSSSVIEYDGRLINHFREISLKILEKSNNPPKYQ